MNNLKLNFKNDVVEYDWCDGNLYDHEFWFTKADDDDPMYAILVEFDIDDNVALDYASTSMNPNDDSESLTYSGNPNCVTVARIAVQNLINDGYFTTEEFREKILKITQEEFKVWHDALISAFYQWWKENVKELGWDRYGDKVYQDRDDDAKSWAAEFYL